MTRPSPLTIIVWAIVVVLAMAACQNASAATRSKAPTYAGVCDFEHRMDIEIIDGIWWECQCIALARGWDCAWVELGPAAVENRKHWRRYRKPTVTRPAAPVVAPKPTTGSSMRNSPWLAGDSWAQANL